MKKILAALVMFVLIGAGVVTVSGTQNDIKILTESNIDLVYVKIFEQPPNFDRNHGSDINFGSHPKMYENLWGINNDIVKLTWWGLALNVDENTGGWINGTPEGMNFFIFFYDDSDEQSNAPPDELIRSFDFSAEDIEVTHTGEYFYPKKYVGKHELIKFDCELPPVSLSDGDGWISIQSYDDTENDLFLWMTGSGGDNFSYQENGLELLYYDTALCLYRLDRRPDSFSIAGIPNGKPNVEYNFTLKATDPENDEVSFFIDWGDNSSTGWTSLLPSGVNYTYSHTWSKEGNFIIKAKVKDSYGAESDWVNFNISIAKSKVKNMPLFLQRFFQRFPFFEKILKQY